MDLETRRFGFTDFFNTVPKCISSSYSNPLTDLETRIAINSLVQDDKIQLINLLKRLFVSNSLDRADDQTAIVSKLLRFCCSFDSINCATSLVNGELGPIAVVNEVDKSSGMSAIHVAAESHAARCVEMLLKKRARTDIKSKDGRGLLALELSLSSSRMDVTWNPNEYSVEDLIVMLGEKDLTTVKLLSEKTKEVDEVAYANAVGGRIVALAALLVVAADKVNESILVLHDSDLGVKEKTTIYECVIKEALSLGRATTTTTTLRAVKRNCTPSKSESAEKRKLLLCEIELLQLFDAVAHGSRTDKKVASPLILATQAGDEAVIEMLLKSNIDVNEADAEGNSALHCALKTSSVGSFQHEQQNRIVGLLLKHGARVSQKNKLGLTALHIAAGSGNSQALEVFIREDPDCINFKTIMKETPLFFAVKNDHMICAELLLRRGANSEVLNLRRERPIDLAKSQDMRFLLKAANICHTNLAFISHDKHNASLESEDVISENCEALLSIMDESTNTERIWSSAKVEVCKYFESPTGCIRGSKCFYAHGEEELQKTKQGMHLIRSPREEYKRKIFVGGLPLSLDSDTLAEIFEEHFGSVEDARVVEIQIEKQLQSRGFGFVTFKHEKSVSAAVQARFVTIMSKQVEIKSALPRELLLAESQKQSALQEESEQNQSQQQAKSPVEKTTEEMTSRKVKEEILSKKMAEEIPFKKIAEDAKTEEMSWAGKLLHGQPKACSNVTLAQVIASFEEKNTPKWLRTLKNWLPRFLKDVYRNPIEGEYALSSLKSDFKAAFGLELDHASLGYPKLSDFMRTLPNLCHVKVGTISKNGSPNHMVLLPCLPRPKGRVSQSFPTISLSSPSNSVGDSNDSDFNGSKSPQEIQSVPYEYSVFTISTIEGKSSHDVTAQRDTATSVNSVSKNTSMIDYSRFLQFLKPGLFSDYRNDGGTGGNNNGGGGGLQESAEKKLRPLPRHAVLEALARKRNNRSEFFLREVNFYDDYKASLNQVKCFGCNQRQMLWANFPCQHLLWCSDCRLQAVRAADGHEHKCVICDEKVEKINFLPSNRYNQPLSGDLSNPESFPPLYSSHIGSLQRGNLL